MNVKTKKKKRKYKTKSLYNWQQNEDITDEDVAVDAVINNFYPFNFTT